MGPFRRQGVDRRQLEPLIHGAAEALAGRGGGHLQFLEEHIEAIDHQLAGFGLTLEQPCGSSAHLLQGHIRGREGAGLLKDVAQPAGVHRQDAGVTGHHGIAHVAEEPGQVADRLLHPLRAVAPHADRCEAGGQNHPHIGVTAGTFEQPGEDVAAARFGAGEGLHRFLEGHLVGRQGRFGCADAQGCIQIGEGSATGKDAVGGAGHDGIGIGRDAT